MDPGIHIKLFLTILKSPVLPLFIVLPSFCFSFSSISPPPTRSFWWCLGSLSVWGYLRSAMPCSCTGSKQGLSWIWPALPRPAQHWIRGHLRQAPCPCPPGTGWSSQAQFFQENVRLLIIQMIIGQNTESRHSLSSLPPTYKCTCDTAVTPAHL